MTKGQKSVLRAAVVIVMMPSARIVFPQSIEMIGIPRLPINKPVQPITDDHRARIALLLFEHRGWPRRADELPAIEAGSMHSAKIQGAGCQARPSIPRWH